MSLGVIYALVAAIGYSLRSLLYKIVEKRGFDRNIFMLTYRSISVPISLCVLKLSNSHNLFLDFSSSAFGLILLVVVISYLADTFYFYGFARIEMSLSSIFSRVAPIFSLIISFIFLHQIPESATLLGICIIVIVSVWVAKSLVANRGKQNDRKEILSFIVGNVLYTFNGTFISQIYEVTGGMSFVFYFSLITAGIYLVNSLRQKSLAKLLNRRIKEYGLLLCLNLVAIISFVSNVEAFGMILVPVAYALTSCGFILTFILSYLFLGERENLIKKIVATLGMIVGGVLTIS